MCLYLLNNGKYKTIIIEISYFHDLKLNQKIEMLKLLSKTNCANY